MNNEIKEYLLDHCRDVVAKKHGYENWGKLTYDELRYDRTGKKPLLYDQYKAEAKDLALDIALEFGEWKELNTQAGDIVLLPDGSCEVYTKQRTICKTKLDLLKYYLNERKEG